DGAFHAGLTDADARIGLADAGLAPLRDRAGRLARRPDLDALAAADRLHHAAARHLDAAMLDEDGEDTAIGAGEEFRAAHTDHAEGGAHGEVDLGEAFRPVEDHLPGAELDGTALPGDEGVDQEFRLAAEQEAGILAEGEF